MAYLLTHAKTSSDIVAGIIGTIDIGSAIGNSITFNIDIQRAQEVQNRINAYYKSQLPVFANRAIEYANMTPEGLLGLAKTNLPLYQKFVTDNTVNQVVQSGAGFRAAATMLGLESKIYTALNEMDMLDTVLFTIPEAVCKIKAARYFNMKFGIGFPSDRDAFILARNNIWTYTQYTDFLKMENGFDDKTAAGIFSIRNQQIGKPSLRDAYLWVKKGLVAQSYFERLAQFGYGFDTNETKILFSSLDYDLSPMEIFRITDLTNVNEPWIEKKLKAVGLNDEDKALMKTMILHRAAKAELDKTWALLLDQYTWGLITADDLTAFMTGQNIDPTEQLNKLTIATMLRSKVVITLMRDAEIYLYRKAVYNENQLLTALQDLNVALDVANAIVRNEAAKQGVDWEIPPP